MTQKLVICSFFLLADKLKTNMSNGWLVKTMVSDRVKICVVFERESLKHDTGPR